MALDAGLLELWATVEQISELASLVLSPVQASYSALLQLLHFHLNLLLLLLLLLLLQVTSIHIPSVRELPSEEWAARQAAATSWRAAVKAHGQRQGLAKPPPEVRPVVVIQVTVMLTDTRVFQPAGGQQSRHVAITIAWLSPRQR
jgi:hypothetical protein